MRTLLSYIRFIVLLGLGTSAVSHAAVFQNLVVNGTFTVASGQAGAGWTGTYSQRSSGPVLNGGGSYFFAGAVSSREVNQVYTLTSSEQTLCKGAVGVNVQGMRYFLSADLFGYQDQNDYSRVIVEFRNSAGTVLTSHTLDSRSTRPPTWASTLTAGQAPNYQSGSGWAPLGTTSVRIRVIATRAQGDNNDGYVDNVRFELRPSNFIKPLGASGDLVRIPPGQIETENSAPFVQVAAGINHSLALKGDGTVVAWGSNGYGQSSVPSGLSGVTAIAAGGSHSLALKSDGTVVAWGWNGAGQSSVPSGLSGVTAIAAGLDHSLALKGDGTVVAWGRSSEGQRSLPAGLSGVTAIAAGLTGSAARLSNGRWITWGQAPSTADDPWWARNVLDISSGLYGLTHVIRSTQPEAPHWLFLAKGALWENRSGDVQDTLWPDDPNRGDTHTYQLVSGEGDEDNGLFTLAGQALTLTTPVDYEQKSSYRLRARVTDSTGLSHEQALVLAVVDDDLEDADNDGLTQRQETTLGTSDTNPDMDNDGYLDGADALPFDPTEWLDTDGDGIGNNADPDDDNDGIPDGEDPNPLTQDFGPSALELTNTNIMENQSPVGVGVFSSTGSASAGTLIYTLVAGQGDADNSLFSIAGNQLTLPAALNFEQAGQRLIRVRVTDAAGLFFERTFTLTVLDDDQEDFDNDGLTQAQEAVLGTSDLVADTDGDSHLDGADAFPLNSAEWLDTDGDGIGNNSDPDDDNDGAVDAIDAFPLNHQEMVDSDGDGMGNNADPDDDNDGIADTEDLTPEGTNPARLDLGFGTNGRVRFPIGSSDDLGHAVAVQTDGRIVVAGIIWNGSNMDFGVARFLPDGAPDTSFSDDGKVITPIGGGMDYGQCVAVQPDGKIVMAGHSYNGSHMDVAVVRYTAAGVLDTTFSGDGIFTLDLGATDDRVNAIHILSDGKILLAGDSGPVGNGQFALLRLTSAGVPDTTFGGGTGRVLTAFGDGYVAGWAMAVQDDGRIVMAGEANGDFAVARYLTNGSLDVSFNGTGKLVTDVSGSGNYDHARAVAMHRDGKIIVAGNTQPGNAVDVAVARYTPEGQLDASFGVEGLVVTDVAGDNDAALAVAVRDDKILLAGRARPSQDDDFLLMRFTAAGSLDPAFNGNGMAITKVGNGDDLALAMAVQPDGKIVMAGFSNSGSGYDFALVRHMGDPPVPEIVVERSSGEALADDSSMLAMQVFTPGQTIPSSHSLVIRNVGDETLRNLSVSLEGPGAWQFQTFTFGMATHLAKGGSTTFSVQFNPTSPGFHAALLKITSNDPDESPFEIHLSGYASGSATLTSAFGVIDSSPFTPHSPVPRNEYGTAMALQPDQKIVVVGRAEDGSTSDAIIARYHRYDGLDTSFNGSGRVTANWPGGTDAANAVAIQSDGKILVAGNSGSDFAVARYTAAGVPDVGFSGGVVLTDFAGGSDVAQAIALQADGRILVAGWAMVAGQNRFALARYLANGVLDPSFGNGGKITTAFSGQAMAYGMALDANGRILLAGQHIGVVPGVAVACYLQDGTLDSGFGAGGKVITTVDREGIGMSVIVQPDGRILVGGSTASGVGPTSHLLCIRYLPNGGLDTDFNGTGIATASNGAIPDFRYGFSLALQSDGRILLGGNTLSDFTLARFTPQGRLDTTYHGTGLVELPLSLNGPSSCRSVAVESDGSILMAGASPSHLDFTQDLTLIRLPPAGAANQAPVADAGGPYVISPGDELHLDASLSSDPDATSGSGIVSYAWMIGEGQTFDDAGGTTPRLTWEMLNHIGISGPGTYRVRLRVTDDHGYSDTADTSLRITGPTALTGGLDPSFGNGGKAFADDGVPYLIQPNDTGHALAVQADGKIVIAGQSGGDFALARFTRDGLPDSGFSGDGMLTTPLAGGEEVAHAVAIQSDGKIIAAGTSGNDFAIARYTATGVPDVTFGGGAVMMDFGGVDSGHGMVVQPDGKILVAGWAQVGPQFRFALARLMPDGQADPSFGTHGKTTTAFNGDAYGYGLALQQDGKIVVGGHLINGPTRGVAVARYLTDGSLDPEFGGTGKVVTPVGGDSLARAVVIQPDGKILVGGSTTSDLMQVSSFLAVRYLPDGTLDTGFNGSGIVTINNGTEFDIRHGFGIALQADGRILLAGNTMSDFSLARLMADGSLDNSFRGNGLIEVDVGSYEDACRAIALQADGQIVLAGSSVSQQLGRTRFALARIENDFQTPAARFEEALAEAGLSGAAADASATPFGDGVSNLLKYAFNMDLTGPDSSRLVRGSGLSGLPSFITTASGEGQALEIQYIRRRNSGLIYTLKASETLAPGSFLAVSSVETVEVIDETWERVTSSIPMNVATKPRFFTTVEVRLE